MENDKRLENLERHKDYAIKFIGIVETTLKHLDRSITEIKENHLHALNNKLNWVIGMVVITLVSAVILKVLGI